MGVAKCTGWSKDKANLRISAFLREKSAIKNLMIAKAYRQQTVLALKVRGLLSFMTRRLVTPDDENAS